MTTFADKIIHFNQNLAFTGALPDGIRIMNPFQENPNVLDISATFYKKYYDDNQPRHLILGINPGRLGAGLTGVPFTDPKRMKEKCGIDYQGASAHEPSSVFVYEVIEAYGGNEKFYQDFYINSPCPLGFTKMQDNGKEVNYNYYDSKALTAAVYDFMLETMDKHLALGVKTDVAFCFGAGQNYKFLKALNEGKKYFEKLIPLDHPRFIMQYKTKSKDLYIEKYLEAFRLISDNES
jgi:Domain of unknown function (DUF4918)